MRLHAIVRTAKAIYTEFNLAVKPRIIQERIELAKLNNKNDIDINKLSSDLVITADELLSIFIYVLCQCYEDIHYPLTTKDLLWAVSYPELLHGEAGYYLTVFESAIESIMQEPFNPNEALLACGNTNNNNDIVLDNNNNNTQKIIDTIQKNNFQINNNNNDPIKKEKRSSSTDLLYQAAKTSVTNIIAAVSISTTINSTKI